MKDNSKLDEFFYGRLDVIEAEHELWMARGKKVSKFCNVLAILFFVNLFIIIAKALPPYFHLLTLLPQIILGTIQMYCFYRMKKASAKVQELSELMDCFYEMHREVTKEMVSKLREVLDVTRE